MTRPTIHRVHSKGIGLHYETLGNGSPILLISGSGASALSWESEFTQSLAENYKILTFDNRGTGRSDRPDSGYSIPEMAEDCVAILDAEDIGRAHVVGASMGGRIAIELTLARPEKVGSLVLCCTNCCSGQQELLSRPTLIRQSLKAFIQRKTDSRLNMKALEFYFRRDFIEENRERLGEHWRKISEYPTPLHIYKKQIEGTLAHEVCNRLGQIAVPTLVLGGDSDLMNPAERLRELAAGIPKAQLHVYTGLGHGFIFEARKDVANRILEFLDGIPDYSAESHDIFKTQ